MRVNFFVIATPKLLDGFPASYVTSFHLPEAQAAFVNRLSQRFPAMTVIDTSAILRQVQSMADKVIRAVQFVFLFALGAGVLVLYAALLATQDERVQEAAVMRALGASRAQVLATQRAEFVALGLLAGCLRRWRDRDRLRDRDARAAVRVSREPLGVAGRAAARARLRHAQRVGGCARGAEPAADPGAARSVSRDATPYELLGGAAKLRELVDRFYDLMDLAPDYAGVRKLHPTALATSREKLFMFLSGWLADRASTPSATASRCCAHDTCPSRSASPSAISGCVA